MKVHTNTALDMLTGSTKALLTRMQGSLCGIDHEIGFLLPSSRDANVIVTGAEMTGIHTLLDLPRPGLGAYHLGGCGVFLNEAIIRTLGETIERYSQMTSGITELKESYYATYQQMCAITDKVMSPDEFNYFIPEQYYQQNFPFDLYSSENSVRWIKLFSLLGRDYLWVPAQLVLVGYKINRNQHEPWIAAAVTTGTAAHTDLNLALINAIMELIQIDSAMGHWYSAQVAIKINFDERTQVLDRLIKKYNNKQRAAYSFYWLKNPDMPGFSIACVYRSPDGAIPSIAIGLGSSLQLIEAMYKAFLEAVGVIGLARMVIFDRSYHLTESRINPKTIYDLDSNVAYYALGQQQNLMAEKFPHDKTISASHLPDDILLSSEETINFLFNAFSLSYKQLLFYNLTGVEAKQLGFVVPRVWSPDLLSLSLPSAPCLNHRRYLAYGGIQHEYPHPYP